MSKPSNEQLCALAQKGDTHATNLLLEYNSGFIRKTANEIFLKSNLVESDLSIEIGDLEQEGSIGLLKASVICFLQIKQSLLKGHQSVCCYQT